MTELNEVQWWGPRKPRAGICAPLTPDVPQPPDVSDERWLLAHRLALAGEPMVICDGVIGQVLPRGAAKADIDVELLTLESWLTRSIARPDYMIGEVFSTTNRSLVSAKTGLGKTHLLYALGMNTAAGRDFLHWRIPRARRVLVVDGEMSEDLIRERLVDAVRRIGGVRPEGFYLLSCDAVPSLPPLNKGGAEVVDHYIERIGGVDLVIFDNKQSLLAGSLKEEQASAEILPWTMSLSRRKIGQIWVTHTGYDTSHAYGTSTQTWQMSNDIVLEPAVPDGSDLAFKMKFIKARSRKASNRSDFEDCNISLQNDEWVVAGATPAEDKATQQAISRLRMWKAVNVLVNMFGGTAQFTGWMNRCVLLHKEDGEERITPAIFRKYILPGAVKQGLVVKDGTEDKDPYSVTDLGREFVILRGAASFEDMDHMYGDGGVNYPGDTPVSGLSIRGYTPTEIGDRRLASLQSLKPVSGDRVGDRPGVELSDAKSQPVVVPDVVLRLPTAPIHGNKAEAEGADK